MKTTSRHRIALGMSLALFISGGAIAADDMPNVEKIQQILLDLGYEAGEIDGEMGLDTRSAIKLFQQDFELAESGKVNQKTLKQLEASHRKMLTRRKQKIDASSYAFYGPVETPNEQVEEDEPTVAIAEADEGEEEIAEADDEAAEDNDTALEAEEPTDEADDSDELLVEDDWQEDGEMSDGGMPESTGEPDREFSLLAVTQEQLDELGYDPGNFEGEMTEETRETLREFQEDNDLPITGEADAATNNALNEQMKEEKRRQIAEQKAVSSKKSSAPTQQEKPVVAAAPEGDLLSKGYFELNYRLSTTETNFRNFGAKVEADSTPLTSLAVDVWLNADEDDLFIRYNFEGAVIEDNNSFDTDYAYIAGGFDMGLRKLLSASESSAFDIYGTVGAGMSISESDSSDIDFDIGLRGSLGARAVLFSNFELDAEVALNKIGPIDGTRTKLAAGYRANSRLAFFLSLDDADFSADLGNGGEITSMESTRLGLRFMFQ